HVLGARVIHRRLAPDRRVDLGEQGRRNLNEIDAPLVARRGEAGDIADDAAPERDEAGVAMELGVDELVEDAAQGRERLVLLAVRQDDDARVAVAERDLYRL